MERKVYNPRISNDMYFLILEAYVNSVLKIPLLPW